MEEGAFVNTNGKSGINFGKFFNRKTFGLLVILVLVAVVPLVVMVSQQSQDIRQGAASSSNLLPANLQSATFTNDPGAGASGKVWVIPQQSITTTYVLSGSIENLAAKVGGVPYKAEIAVDIYDQYYPGAVPGGQQRYQNYDTRIISSSNSQENVSGPKTFTVNANYKAYLIFRTYNATANFKDVSLKSKVTGPCYGRAAGTCTFDTRTFVPGSNLESITAYGKYWNITDNAGTLAPAAGSGDLTEVSRYTNSNGPCAGKSKGECKFDTRTFASNGWESITAYGKYWNIKSDGSIENSGNLADVSVGDGTRYKNGPCSGGSGTSCKFDTRTFASNGWESITAGNSYWNFLGNNLVQNGNGGLNTVSRYQSICANAVDPVKCTFSTRTFAPNGWESITAYGKYFNFQGNNLVNSGDLTTAPNNKYSRAYEGSNVIPSDLQNPTFTNDPGVGKFDVPVSPVARTFTLSGLLNNVAAKVGGVPYQAEVAVDIYKPGYPQDTSGVDYSNRIILSSDTSRNRNISSTGDVSLAFTVPASYKAFVLYRLYNATAKFNVMSLTYDIPNTPTPAPTQVYCMQVERYARNPSNPNECQLLANSCATPPAGWTVSDDDPCPSLLTPQPTAPLTPGATFTPVPTRTPTPTQQPNNYSILGTVYLDSNGNGQKDSNENAAPIGTPSIDVSDSTTSYTVVRAGDSTYHSDNLSPKEYFLTFTVPTGYKLTARNISISAPDSGTCYTVVSTWTAIPFSECVGGKRFQTKFNITSSNVTVNFGIQPLPTATSVPPTATSIPATATPTTGVSNITYSISGRVYAGTNPYTGSLSVSSNEGGTITYTASSGTFIIAGLPTRPSNGSYYQISMPIPSGYKVTSSNLAGWSCGGAQRPSDGCSGTLYGSVLLSTFSTSSPAQVTITLTSLPTATSVPATAIPTTPTNLAADVDQNSCISINDFNAWLYAFWHNGTPTDTRFKPDMNGDGQVTLEDYNVWFSAYRAGQNLCQ